MEEKTVKNINTNLGNQAESCQAANSQVASNQAESIQPAKPLKVSVVMCTYNGAAFIRVQLDSIVRQTYPIHELIIQDDGSTDATVTIIEEYAQRYPYLKFYRNEGPHGINGNFFSAMRRATGDVIAIADQDDIWELQKNEWQVEALGNNLLVAGLSKPFATDNTPISYDDRLPNIHLFRMMYVGMIPGHTQVFRRELLDFLPERNAFMYDLQLQVVAACLDKIVYLPKVLVHQRRHVTAATYAQPISNERSLANMFRYVQRSLRLYREARPIIRDTFSQWISFLNEVQAKGNSLTNNKLIGQAIHMAELQASRSFLGWMKLTCFCMRNAKCLFHAKEPNQVLAVLRGTFFPISCATYYRDLIKHH